MRPVDAVHLFKINNLRIDGSFLFDARAQVDHGTMHIVVPQLAPPGSKGWLAEAPTNRYFDGWWEPSELFGGWVESHTQPPSVVAYTVRMLAVVVDAEVDDAARGKTLQEHPVLTRHWLNRSLEGLSNGYGPTAGSRKWAVLSRWTSSTS
jgi:hypothetical protein